MPRLPFTGVLPILPFVTSRYNALQVNSLFPLLDSQCQLRNPSDKGFVVSLFQVGVTVV